MGQLHSIGKYNFPIVSFLASIANYRDKKLFLYYTYNCDTMIILLLQSLPQVVLNMTSSYGNLPHLVHVNYMIWMTSFKETRSCYKRAGAH